MEDFTPAAALAVSTVGQRDELADACEAILELEVGSLTEVEANGGSSSDLAVGHNYVDDAEALAERIDAGGSVCLIPGRLVGEVWACLTDELGDLVGEASDPDLTDPDDRAALACRAQDLFTLLAGLAPTPA